MIGSLLGLGVAGGGLGVLFLIALYLLPTIIGAQRKVVNIGSVAAINILLGWTLIGWVVALAMALRTNPPHAYPQFWGNGSPATRRSPNAGRHAPSSQVGPSQPRPVNGDPGWYQDPWGVGKRRWNGSNWTSETSV
jgi:hypothetical protein